jgi:phage terminase small subunit
MDDRADSTAVGPAMQALNERQRRYVHALFEAPRSYGSGVFAAKAAGYSDSSRQVLASQAHQLNADPKVQAAIAEVSQQHLTTLGPPAVRAMKRVLNTPNHRDFGRVIGIVMDRVAPAQSTHTLEVKGEVRLSAGETAKVMDRIEELCRKFAVAVPAPKIIEHKPEEAAA